MHSTHGFQKCLQNKFSYTHEVVRSHSALQSPLHFELMGHVPTEVAC